MKLSRKIKCPYCGFSQPVLFEKERGAQLVTCDFENGGCEAEFVVQHSCSVQAMAIAVPGLEPKPDTGGDE